ncbi:MAG: TIGR00341 family protein [Parcubacteria group bacterium]|nr:TIGR00341 family protein [Parcubacteria group bacterium]
MFSVFNNLTEDDKALAITKMIEQSRPSKDFFLMIALSVLMAAFGLIMNNIPVLIGSMLVAPLLSPVLSLALGFTISDTTLVQRSLITIGKSIIVAVIAAATATLLFGNGTDMSSSYMEPSLLHIAVAIVAGLAASFAIVKKELNEMLPGVAIAVALIPPIAMTGVGLAKGSWIVMTNGFIIFLLNVIGIVFAAMVTFSLMNFYVRRGVAMRAIEKEKKEMAEEEERKAAETIVIKGGESTPPTEK